MADPVTSLAIASVVASGVGAYGTYDQTKQMKKQAKQQREEAERVKAEETQKQQQLANTYKGMKSTLFSGEDNTGINTNQLIQ